MQGNRLPLRSKKPGMVRQELWGTLLAYNLNGTDYVQPERDTSLPDQPQPGCGNDHQGVDGLTGSLAGESASVIKAMTDMAPAFVLPIRRERIYPRAQKSCPCRPVRKKNASQLA